MIKNILLVDDDEMLLRCTKRCFGRRFEIDIALSGSEGLEMIESLPKRKDIEAYAVILSDLSMPRMNGKVFLQKAKQLSPKTILFLLTGNQDSQTNVQAESKYNGLVERFLHKPCDPELLAEAVEWGIQEFAGRHDMASV